jgi:hypothetical protein
MYSSPGWIHIDLNERPADIGRTQRAFVLFSAEKKRPASLSWEAGLVFSEFEKKIYGPASRSIEEQQQQQQFSTRRARGVEFIIVTIAQ